MRATVYCMTGDLCSAKGGVEAVVIRVLHSSGNALSYSVREPNLVYALKCMLQRSGARTSGSAYRTVVRVPM